LSNLSTMRAKERRRQSRHITYHTEPKTSTYIHDDDDDDDEKYKLKRATINNRDLMVNLWVFESINFVCRLVCIVEPMRVHPSKHDRLIHVIHGSTLPESRNARATEDCDDVLR
jgi:hypothetical protein